jgi:branched-chain amino acid transport system substrate-binding protein
MHQVRRLLATAMLALAGALDLTPAGAQTAAPPIKIGMGMALSGGLAAGGKQAVVAYELWADDVNARGGLLGRKVELIKYDDQSNPATVPGIYSKLLDVDKVDIVLSGYGTVPTAAALPLIIQRKKMFLSLFALAANDEFKYDRYFQMQPNGPDAKVEFSRGFFELAAALNPKPKTVAIAGADAEFSVLAMQGARENAKKHDIRVVYDRTYPPSSVEFGTVVRAIKATNPDLVYIASYPPDSAGMIRSVHEVGLSARMLGGGMIGLQFAALKGQLGPLINDIVCYELYAPEPTLKFPGTEQFLVRYRERAASAGTDPLGLYIPPYAFAEMQILEASVKAAGSLDDAKLAEHARSATFETVAGNIKFGARGEWAEPRILLAQYRDIQGNDVEQFKQPGKTVILHPPQYKSGDLKMPFEPGKR